MFHHPFLILILLLWLLPVVFFVLLPLFHTLVGALRFFLGNGLFVGRLGLGREKRCLPRRTPRRDIFAVVTDGVASCTGLLRNASSGGLCLSRLPDNFFSHNEPLTVTVKNNGPGQRLHVIPVWRASTASGTEIGARIEEPSPAWNHFLQQM